MKSWRKLGSNERHKMRIRWLSRWGLMTQSTTDPNEEHLWRDEETLRELYVEKRLSQSQIADRLGCAQTTVGNWLRKHEIEVRDLSEARRLRGQMKPLPLRTDKNGYECWRDEYKKDEGEPKQRVAVHRLLYVAHHGFEAVRDKDIHHVNGVKWDNRPENLEALTRSEHVVLHNSAEPKSATS